MASSRFINYVAPPEDDALLKKFYDEKTHDGNIQITPKSKSSFFNAIEPKGRINYVFGLKDITLDKLAACGIFSIKDGYFNGVVEQFGYLSGLEVDVPYRKTSAMARIFRRLHEDYQTRKMLYILTIFDDNITALKTLPSGKGGMPKFTNIGQYCTHIFKPQIFKSKANSDITVRKASSADIETIVHFFHEEGSKRQFFPQYTAKDFSSFDGLLRNLSVEDIFLAFRNDILVGTMALWDQSEFKQWIVKGYGDFLRTMRPLINVYCNIVHKPSLPPINYTIPYKIISLQCIKNNDNEVFISLLQQLNSEAAKSRCLLSAGFMASDPLYKYFKFPSVKLKSNIFVLSWKETESKVYEMDSRIPYLELGAL